ncbi:MAG: CPBP family intramembrane metalloprotease [Spirochaetes bacterium]|nr:CPBP family intramembrane metalloprotease [Spirochaetota bacterium]
MNNIRINNFSKISYLMIISPFIIILSGFLTAKFAGIILKEWAWIPLTLVLWGLMGFFIFFGLKKKNLKIQSYLFFEKINIYKILSLIAGFIPFALFLMNINLIKNNKNLIIFWLLFSIINPFFEEFYFRGVLLIYTENWKAFLSVLYSTFLFAVNHPISWGVNSIANRHPVTFISTFIMGLVWAINFKKCKDLLFPIIGHFLVDLFNLSVFIFLNIYVPMK